MNAEEISRPNVPIAYVRLTLEQAEERGVRRQELLRDVDVSAADLERPDARIPLLVYGRIVARALRKTGDPGLGYDFGLRAGLTTHGPAALGLMSQATVRDGLEFMRSHFAPLRSPGFTSRVFVDGDRAIIDVREAVQYGPIQQYAIDMALVGLTQLTALLFPLADTELWFACARPSYYEMYRDRLPRVRFAMGANQIRFPAAYLDRATGAANPITARLVARDCEREMAVLGHDDRVLARVRGLLATRTEESLALETVARRLGMSSRTLKRRLHEHGFTFRALVEEGRRQDSVRLLRETHLSIEEVGRRVGYSAHTNFIRAFRKWTGMTPGAFRSRLGTVAPGPN